jgi:hypothetical protein
MSGDVVKLKDVSDFVTPSQVGLYSFYEIPIFQKCILPFSKTKEEDKPAENGNLMGVKIKSRKKINAAVNGKSRVKVTLEDCLACSGCVTTTELEW